ncbi:uncharacterized protein LOC114957954 [Acropora millepora]|uniref:uncharacterized protein LOC114957954 n=1 Tax=Acropora millepora TaxID=45264 RepID=UPI001CF252FF|nr:uncharacterized protein LOC114957954 [Acropora millepora]
MAENHSDDFGDDHVDVRRMPPRANDDENSHLEKETEDPQVVSVNQTERDVRAAVMRVEASNERSPQDLDQNDVAPQQQALEVHHQLREKTPTTDFCDHSVPTPFPGFMVLIFLLMKKLPGGNIALYRLYIIPYEAYRLMREICQESQDGQVRQLSFFVNHSRMQEYHNFFLENNEKITVGFKITNHAQQNFRGWEEGCHQFDSFQILSQSQNRMGDRVCKASFCVQYRGEDDELCQEQGEITLTYNSNPAMRMTLLFSISNYVQY